MMAAPLCFVSPAHAQSADDANKSNNPLSPAASLNFQNYYTPKLFGSNAHTNDFLIRPTLPVAPGEFIGVPQILRFTAPVSTRPQADGSYKTGLGDLNVFDIFLLKQGALDLGVGPMLTMPSATSSELGAGKAWRVGKNIFNVFAEPQWTVAHRGEGLSQFTLFAGLNITFGN